jgi:hypothetical protein
MFDTNIPIEYEKMQSAQRPHYIDHVLLGGEVGSLRFPVEKPLVIRTLQRW